MDANGVKAMKDFAAEIGVHRHTIGDIVAIQELPTEKMQHGMAKGLSPQTQSHILRILGIKPPANRVPTAAGA